MLLGQAQEAWSNDPDRGHSGSDYSDEDQTELDLPTPLPPVSVIGIDFLFEPDVLVELEAYAVLDQLTLFRRPRAEMRRGRRP